MIYGFECDPSWEPWDESGWDLDEFNHETGNAQHMAYYPPGYYPTETWNLEDPWEGEAIEEDQKQNEQGEDSEA